MRKELFFPSQEAEIRILLLIHKFTGKKGCLEGRTKLAKLDFFLRYPEYLKRAFEYRSLEVNVSEKDVLVIESNEENNIENKMVRYRYGPWDPSYYAILGRLIGKGLIETKSFSRGIGYSITDKGRILVNKISKEESWESTIKNIKILYKYFNLQGSKLKNFIYKNFPEVTNANWGDKI